MAGHLRYTFVLSYVEARHLHRAGSHNAADLWDKDRPGFFKRFGSCRCMPTFTMRLLRSHETLCMMKQDTNKHPTRDKKSSSTRDRNASTTHFALCALATEVQHRYPLPQQKHPRASPAQQQDRWYKQTPTTSPAVNPPTPNKARHVVGFPMSSPRICKLYEWPLSDAAFFSHGGTTPILRDGS